MWSGRRLTQIQATTRLENLWTEVWSKMGKAAQMEGKQAWANEKPKLDNAQRLRDIKVIDTEDGKYEETLKNARRKLEVPMEAAMPCTKRNKEALPVSGGCTQRKCKPNEIMVEEYRKMFESRISAGATEKYQGGKKHHAKTVAWSLRHGRTRSKSALRDIAN